MTSEEIKATIGRLRECDNHTLPTIFDAFTCSLLGNHWCNNDVIEAIVALLEQADPETHMELPKDADGAPIRIGEEVCGYNHPNGGVYCYAIVNPCVIAVGDMADYGNSKGWELWNTLDVRHYHMPTVEEVLYACCNEYHEAMLLGTCDIPCDVPSLSEVISKYAEKLREAMQGDQ